MLTLDTELEIVALSAGFEVENWRPETEAGEPRRCGIFTPRPPTVGEESGDASARVE